MDRHEGHPPVHIVIGRDGRVIFAAHQDGPGLDAAIQQALVSKASPGGAGRRPGSPTWSFSNPAIQSCRSHRSRRMEKRRPAERASLPPARDLFLRHLVRKLCRKHPAGRSRAMQGRPRAGRQTGCQRFRRMVRRDDITWWTTPRIWPTIRSKQSRTCHWRSIRPARHSASLA